MRPVAVDLGDGLNIRHVGVGEVHSCAVLTNGQIKCWGQHKWGALGAGGGTIKWGDGANEMGDDLSVVPLL